MNFWNTVLCSIGFFCSSSDKISEEHSKNIKMLAASWVGEVFLCTQQPPLISLNSTLMEDFDIGITALARYKDYFFVSTVSEHFKNIDNWTSYIYRCNFDWKNIKLNGSSCEIFHTHTLKEWQYFECMVVVNDTLFAGHSVGDIWRCSVTESKKYENCKIFKTVGYYINGIDYDPASNKIYAISSDGHLLHAILDR